MTASALRAAGPRPWQPVRAVVTLAIFLTCLAPTQSRAEEEEEGLPILESGTAMVDLGTRRMSIRYSTTIAGVLVEVEPLIAELGGTLELGPLGESHRLTLNQTRFEFGPKSDAVTSGKEIVDLSQKTIAADGGAQVPLDLLNTIYGFNLGYEFEWSTTQRLLTIRHQPARDIDLAFNLVQVQGVTTVVFQFSMRPRYRVREVGSSVIVELIGDRISEDSVRSLPPNDLVRGVTVAPDGVRMLLAREATAEDYVLNNPFRLVFDVFRDDSRTAAPIPRQTSSPQNPRNRRDREPGIRTIVLDPGHGGVDTGAVGRSGLEEKRLSLQIARTMKRLLEAQLPVRVVLTRDRDIEVPLPTRAALANQNKGDLFVSIHLNSSVGGGARGAEVFFLSLDAGADSEALSRAAAAAQAAGGGAGDPLFDLQLTLWDLAQRRHLQGSQDLAQLIQEELNVALELGGRRVGQAPLRVLQGVAMPAVLVELGFLSNSTDEGLLQDPEYRTNLARALVNAIRRYRARVEGLPEEEVSEEATE